ncbi:bifunctional DNA-formamidopyrimidine glycosylase/DNA-(apurinic or apyrimidinic site) lyase [Legionella oakridgensis]|uniref:bifunctional DNA-formamidopyrimidine glycosylase/DNA-(apurinic or apyrimidinic site) lyase n=1 Tax=Legionella oakridgensis TaxID=29423 RepID=UPI0003DE0F8C|nr:bifunctional DNA-formamidopyrimidine glycosylase/DNA-(apurinic or apyrimidinic site) lyase [Legionella oakridgensis]ETO94186.1 formamidopyrimidine-DNA glycosylase [Legionella oakridgensis RV-2-2007]
MPELPEVETTRRGIHPFLLNQTIERIDIRQGKLRFPATPELNACCSGKQILDVSRRAKYLLLPLSSGTLLIHLGMSGYLRLDNPQSSLKKHDHIDMCLSNDMVLRYHDPRRFGFWLYIAGNLLQHPLIAHLGPEPLSDDFNGDFLYDKARGKTQSIKSFIMNNHVVVGIGNIYATESLFLTGIHPQTASGRLAKEQFIRLSINIKQVLQQAITAGGTTLRDFYSSDGKPGYFSSALHVYGRQGQPCPHCYERILAVTIAGRKSTFCPRCQPI